MIKAILQIVTESNPLQSMRNDLFVLPVYKVLNSMTDRFYLPLSYDTATVEIDGTEAHHLLGVMRKKIGDMIELFDGNGTAVLAEIAETKKRSALLRIQKIIAQETVEPMPRIILATAVPKGERFRWLVEKATEIGISKIIPLQTTRSVVQPSAGKIEKMRATIIAACKQCGRNRLMQLDKSITWENLFQNIPQKSLVAVGHPQGAPVSEVIETIKNKTIASQSSPTDDSPFVPSDHLLCIGPEGGLTEEELQIAFNHAALPVRFGNNILRIETAALVLGTIWVDNFRSTIKLKPSDEVV